MNDGHPSSRGYVRTYSGVQRRDDHAFVAAAIRRAGGRVLFASPSNVAPLYLTVEDQHGGRYGIMAYVFHANRRETTNRPSDEHRLQIRYGDVNRAAWRRQHHPVGIDPTGADVTVVVAAHPEADLLVALDPLLYDPLPLGISVFFKDAEIDAARASGWHVWERDNLSGARRGSPRSQFGVETMLALAPERLFDLIELEREAQTLALDPPLRYRAAQRIGRRPRTAPSSGTVHELEQQYELPAGEILAIIAERGRLAMAVRGGVAEHHAGRALRDDPAVRDALVGHQEGPPDYWVTLSDGTEVSVEVKNASPKTYADGTPKVEVQKTRASRGDPLSRLYRPDAFDVLAACMAGPSGRWTFKYRRSNRLTPHPRHSDRIAPLQRIDGGWHDSLGDALTER